MTIVSTQDNARPATPGLDATVKSYEEGGGVVRGGKPNPELDDSLRTMGNNPGMATLATALRQIMSNITGGEFARGIGNCCGGFGNGALLGTGMLAMTLNSFVQSDAKITQVDPATGTPVAAAPAAAAQQRNTPGIAAPAPTMTS